MKHALLLTAAFLLVLLACTPVLAQDREEDPPATAITVDSVQKNAQEAVPEIRTVPKVGTVKSAVQRSTLSKDVRSKESPTTASYVAASRGVTSLHREYTGPRTTAYPTELYYTDNIITFVNRNGIQSVEPTFDSLTESLVTLKSIGDLRGSPDTVLVHLQVHTVTESLNARFLITNAKGEKSVVRLSNRTWRLDEVRFKDVVAGDTICRPFQIVLQGISGFGMSGAGEYLDSVSLPISEAWLSYSVPPPVQIRSGSTYRYNVCFSAPSAGDYKFAVITWIRRAQPAGGFTNYPIADRALVHVLPKQVKESLEPEGKD